MHFFSTVIAPFFVGAFVSFAAMRVREENQRAKHLARLAALESTSVTQSQYALAMREFLAAQAEERGAS